MRVYSSPNEATQPLAAVVIGWMGIGFMIVALGVTVYVKCL